MASGRILAPLPTTTQAWTHSKPGLLRQVLALTPNHPLPPLKENEVLIKVSYAALNPRGPAIMNLMPMFIRTKPSIPEMDFAGTAVAFGPSSLPFASTEDKGERDDGEQSFQIGTKVFGNIPPPSNIGKGIGALSQYIILPKNRVLPIPKNMPESEAAGLGIVGCSALALLDRAGLKEGDRVLINGATGGVGSLLVQMCKDVVGPTGQVVGICSRRNGNVELVKGLGADDVVDYTKHDPTYKYMEDRFKNEQFDAIIDTIGINDLWLHCETYLKPSKPFITLQISVPNYSWSSFLWMIAKVMSNTFKPVFLGNVNRPYTQQNGIGTLENMKRLKSMVEEGKLRVLTDSVWGFGEVLEGYDKLMGRHARGKVIIRINHEDN